MRLHRIRATLTYISVCGMLLVACGAPETFPEAPPTTIPAMAIGQEVVVGSTAWIVKRVIKSGTSYTGNGRTATTGGQYIVIELQITNHSAEEHTLDSDAAELFTSDHAPYKPDTETNILLANPQQCLNRKLTANESATCFFIYNVLPGASPARLLVTELGSSTSTMIDLTRTGTP